MAKNKGSKNEWKRYKKFEQENEKLRKEVSKLRKQVQHGSCDKLAQKAERVKSGYTPYIPTCENCGNESIIPIDINRQDGTFKMGVCGSCQHKTSMKKVKPDIIES